MSFDSAGISITILGSGTCVPSLERSSCSVLLEVGSSKILVDSGPGTMRRLLETDTTIFEISHIFYSHFHPDHSGEFAPLLFSSKYAGDQQREKPLTITAGKGLLNFYNKLRGVYGHWIEFEPGWLNFIELDNKNRDSQRFHSFSVNTAPMAHSEESIGYRFSSPDGSSVVYSGDTDYSEHLIDLAKDADLLICESSMPDSMRKQGHLTPSLAGKIAAESGVKKLVLTHFYPECDHVDVAQQCRKNYSGPLALAEDLMRIEVPS
jgi:ribonuclease BN (tRNA processing enzyme)